MFSNHPGIRLAVYGLAIAAQIAAFFVRAGMQPELAEAFDNTANLLATVAGVTAITNMRADTVDPRENGLGGQAPTV